jgi:glycosyltransferase involved in cell wall biosynthesis
LSAQPLKSRVAVVGPAHPYKGGAVHHTTELARQLAERHFAVTLESWRAQYPRLLYPGELFAEEPDVPTFEPTRHELSWRRPDGWVRHGARIGRNNDLVILQLHSTFQVVSYLVLARLARRHGARVVVIANNVTPHEARAADRRLVRALLSRVDAVLVHNDEQARLAREMTTVPVRVATLPPHFPSNVAPGSERPDTEIRHRLLFFGFVRPYKGLDVLLQAMAKADAAVSLTVAGEFWNGQQQTRELVHDLGLDGRVDLRPGYVGGSAIGGLFEESDALVLPYRKATGSQNTLLSFQHGRPVIVTRAGSLPDAVTDGVDGVICLPDDVDDLARAIDRFYLPGEPLRLRANVKTADWAPLWDAYIDALCPDKTEVAAT